MGYLPANINLLALTVGDTVGLLHQSSGALHFFLNGVHMVELPCTVPKDVHGLVDLHGRCVKVTLRPLMSQSIDKPCFEMTEKYSREKKKELLASKL